MPIMKKLFALLLLLLPTASFAQQIVMQNPQLIGTATPVGQYTCSSGFSGTTYIQTDSTNGRLWLCDQSSGTWAWDHLVSPPSGSVPSATATTGTITGGAAIAGSCFPTTPTTLSISGATVGVNAGVASAIYATAPGGSPGLLNCAAWPSASGVMSAQCCAAGILSTVPSFQIKVLMY